MFRKPHLIVLLLLGLFGGLFFLYRHAWFRSEVLNSIGEKSLQTLEEDTTTTSRLPWPPVPNGSRVHLHPLADPVKLADAKQELVGSWEDWLDATIEVLLAEVILYGRVETPHLSMSWVEDTPEEVTQKRDWLREVLTQYIKHHKAWLKPPPEYPGGFASISELDKYRGPYPPTSESLIAEFNAVFVHEYPGLATSVNEHYPKEAWLETLLEKGAHFEEYGDYRYYLRLRKSLLQQKNKPAEWRSGAHGIPITTDFNEYEDGFLDRKVWEYSIVQKVRTENPKTSPWVFFPINHPDKYLPVVGKMTYVNLGENRQSMSTSGVLLTEEQKENLQRNGIEPEDIEIVYIDDDYNVISEPPPLFDEQKYIRENAISFDGVPLSPENYEELLGHPMPAKWMDNYEKRQTRDTPPIIPDTDAIRTAARDAAFQTQEQFQQGLRELERFSNMSEAEIEAELERRLLPRMPELPTAETLESRLWSEVQSAQMTPARFEAALKILEAYGPEEGMRKLTQADPKAATQVKRILGGASAPEQPPEPPTHPEQQERTAPPEPNAP